MDKLNDILPYIKAESCGLFIGAGLSKIAGCYDWDSIVNKMFDHPILKKQGTKREDISATLGNEQLIEYCQHQFEINGAEDDFKGIIRKATTFIPELHFKHYMPLIKNLKQIQPMPKILLTTNIDNCLEASHEFDLTKVYYKVDDLIVERLNESGIFHIHGFIEDVETSLLTRKKYLYRYKEESFQMFMADFFSNYTVLFLGYGLNDGEIRDILSDTKNGKTKRFLLVPEDDNLTPSTISVYHDLFGITTVIYGRKDDFAAIFSNWIDSNFSVTSLKEGDMATPDA